jgi:uncharacterized protein YjbI with pentapeptide repeats/acetolactate synthase small subunit
MAAGGVVAGAVLKRLLGQTICFAGKFGWGVLDRLQKLAEAQQGVVVDDLNASVNLLVLPDLNSGKTVQKKAASLNAKGASIQVIDADDFEKRVTPDVMEITSLLHAGPSARDVLAKVVGATRIYGRAVNTTFAFTVNGEDFSNHDVSGFDLGEIAFTNCNFDGGSLVGAHLGSAEACTFNGADCSHASIQKVEAVSFEGATLAGASIHGDLTDANFMGAKADGLKLYGFPARKLPVTGTQFSRASLKGAMFDRITLSGGRFDEADLSQSVFNACTIADTSFRSATLSRATLVRCELKKCDWTGADLVGANLADSDLSDSSFDGAGVARANFRGAILNGTDLGKANGYDRDAAQGANVGPALTQLDNVTNKARRIHITFNLDGSGSDDGRPGTSVELDSSGLRYGWGLRLTGSAAFPGYGHSRGQREMSDALLEAARVVGDVPVRFETIDINTTKSPMKANELRQVVVDAVAEAFKQRPPEKEKLAELTKAWREQQREADAINRERREAAKKLQEQQEAERKKQIEQTVRKAVGKVTDIATFLKALELRADKQKIDNATKMLKASGFQLFNDITADHLLGVVKSQTDPDLVYACRIDHEGKYACCTQNLNICGGLRGSICKHLLVLIIGLVKAGELDPATIDGWVAKTHDAKPELDKEAMGEIFIRYKGAEAGEVDWRPTETVPEDYYAL